jgi:hypothetical protein
MKNFLLNALALLLLCGWIMAQSSTDQSNNTNPGTSAQGDRQVSLEGCLAKSGSDYTLRANGRRLYQLQGHTRELDQHLGEWVQVQGTQSNSLSTTGPTEESSGSASALMVQVKSVTKIEEKCPAPAANQ